MSNKVLQLKGKAWAFYLVNLIIFYCGSAHSFSLEKPRNFTQAKQGANVIYIDHRLTFYCGCRYDKHGKIDLRSCGYKIQRDKRRAHRLEWEHIVPVSLWGKSLPCWTKPLCCRKSRSCYKGRACCRDIDPKFARMEADLHNIVPEIGELNAFRSNYRFGMLPFVQSNQFGACEIKIDSETRRVEPRSAIRGLIARAYLYMAKTYEIHLSQNQRQLFQTWNKQHPPDLWEIQRNQRITMIQGNDNPYITQYQDNK